MTVRESFRPTLTEKTVEQALEAMRTGQPLSTDHPLRFFLAVLFRLQSPEMLTGDAAVQVAVFNHLTETIIRRRQILRSVCELAEREGSLEEDFRQGNSELEAWSVLYHRYIRIERSLTMQLIAHHTNQDERTLRRRHSVGITRLTHALIDNEQEVRRLHVRQRLKLALPTVYPPTLIGAESLLTTAQHIMTEAEPPRHLVLHGSIGIGKTSLALALAHQLIERETVEDILWINLRSFPVEDPNTLVREIVSHLGLPDKEAISLVQVLRAYCFAHRVLLVLDEADPLLKESSQAEALLHILDTAHVILTSRVAAPSSMWLYSILVPELSRGMAYKLLETLNVPQSEQILRSFDEVWSAVGGNPLALKLVAASSRHLPLSSALQNVTLERLHDQIWGDLPFNQRQLLLLTLLFQKNAVPYNAFQTLLPNEAVDQIIEALVTKSLLVSQREGSFFYTTPAPMLSFLLDRLAQGKDESATIFLTRLLPLQVSYLLEAPSAGSALATLEIARVMQIDIEDRCQYACDLAPQIIEDGLWSTWFNALASLHSSCRETDQKARVAYLMGQALRWLGDFEQAKVYLEEAAASVGQRADVSVELSVINRYQGYWEEALHLSQEALDTYAQHENTEGVNRCIHEISQIALESGDAIMALTWLSRLPEWSSRSWGIASQSYLILKEYEEALAAAKRALTLLPVSHPNRGRALAMQGQVYHEMGRADEAVENLLVAVDLLDQTKDMLAYARASNNLAIAYLSQASDSRQISFDRVYQLLIRARDIQSHMNDEIGLAVTSQNLSWLEDVRKGGAAG